MNKYATDIETAAQPREAIEHLKPAFTAPGNYKDPVKIAENIAEQERKWFENAALSPLTGRVLVIGIKQFGAGNAPTILEGSEEHMLRNFWQIVGYADQFDQFYGHGLHGFDLPFIVKRSWLHRIPVPMHTIFGDRGYINPRRFIDTMQAFACGDKGAGYIGLDTVARFLGLEGKTEDLGPQFAEVYAQDRPRAIAYHVRDLDLVEAVAERMFMPVGKAA